MKKNCIFIVGPESSGSTLIAKIINTALGNENWIGRGFNCCDNPRCDANNGYIAPCQPMEALACHRSLPFNDTWPPFDKWNESYNAKYIICTRDKNISRISQQSRFKWKDDELLASEEKRAIGILDNLICDQNTSTFIWSYETFILLNKSYLYLLADFLEIPRQNFEYIESPFNGNLGYIHKSEKRSLWSKLFRN